MLTSPAPPKKKKESSDGGAAATEPLSLDDERQLRVRTAAHTGALQLGRCGVAQLEFALVWFLVPFSLLLAVASIVPPLSLSRCLHLQLHYAIQMTQMAAILNLPTHVTVGFP
jgi:hypothetical protein